MDSRMFHGIDLKVKRLHPDAVLPSAANPGDAGLDLTAVSVRFDEEHGFFEYGTGIAVEIPKWHVGLLFVRSSISKYDLRLCNAVGVIDAGYRGEVLLRFKADTVHPKLAKTYAPGDKVGQLVIMPYPHVYVGWADKLSETERGTGGFGSTSP